MRYVLLGPAEGIDPPVAEVEAALVAAGHVRWDGNGDPDFVVFTVAGPKGDYFEAGYWGGRGAHVFFIGGGSRCYNRKQIVNRFAGWSVVGRDAAATLGELMRAVDHWAGLFNLAQFQRGKPC